MIAPISARIVEQPDDWTEPGAHPVIPGVTRIPLPMPNQGLKAVNVYLIDDGDGLTVIDSGWAIPATHRALHRALASIDRSPQDLRTFLVTHAHHDHFTAALDLRADHKCEVRLGRGERPSVESYHRIRDHLQFTGALEETAQETLLRAHGAPELAEAFAHIRKGELRDDRSRWESPDTWLDDGERVSLGRRTLEVLATPGHTRGHVVLRDDSHGLLFAGDHVLPHITPSIGFETSPEALPLRSYLASLRLVRGRKDTLLLPAHGPVTASTHIRVDELLGHHAQRFHDVELRIAQGDATALEIARGLGWTRRGTRLDALDPFNRCLAVLETAAHLDVLVHDGRVLRAEQGHVRVHELADGWVAPTADR